MLCRTQSPLHWKGVEEINIALWNRFKSVRFLRGPAVSAPLRLPDVLQLSQSVGKFSTGRQTQWTPTCNLQPERNRYFLAVYPSSAARPNALAVSKSSHRYGRSLFTQASVIKYNIIMVLFLLLSTLQLYYRYNTLKLIFLARAHRRNWCIIPDADSASHHHLTCTSSGVISQ